LSEPGTTATQAPSTIDSGLRCPKCEYNLTGVIEDRCPECGRAFDRRELLARLAGAPAPIPIWDDAKQALAVRFVKMCLLAWFLPTRLGRMLPRCYSRPSVRKFQRLVFLTATLAAGVPAGMWGGLRGVTIALCAGLASLMSFVTFEFMLCPICAIMVTTSSPTPPYRPETVRDEQTGFFSSFVLLYVLVVGLLFSLAACGVFSASVGDIFFLGAILVGCWWWVCVSASLMVRFASPWAKVGIVLLIPAIAVFAVPFALVICTPVLLFIGFVTGALMGF
jgi:hypothetical protein